jgi:hypothetical protein
MTLTREQAFDLWAPSSSPWSVWAKPVIFAHLPEVLAAPQTSPALPLDVTSWAPSADGGTVLVVDLAGAQCVRVGEGLIRAGFRPVPLFNAVPGPKANPPSAPGDAPRTLVDVQSIVDAIHDASPRLVESFQKLPTGAPPAFLLDANRRLGTAPRPGDFDNRSVSLPTDFPSATFLLARGVSRALLVTSVVEPLAGALQGDQPAADLAHTLLRWQSAGIEIHACSLDASFQSSRPDMIRIARPSWFGAVWHNALSVLGLRRHPLGGFGGTLPLPSAG